ncbi:MAG TPA: hypothetical protein VF899_15565 [Pyrinomonadaceae bacterium]
MSKTLASWVDKYGTGSDSDRIQPALNKPFNARAAALSTDFGKHGSINTEPGALATGCCVRYRIPHQSGDIVMAPRGSGIRSLSAFGSVFVRRRNSLS